MSGSKYAGLPDIDTAPDVYETEDVFPSPAQKGESSDEEAGSYSKSHLRGKDAAHARPDELDTSSIMNTEEASKKFRKAEKRHRRPRIQYTYPSSPTSSGRSSPELSTNVVPLSQRLRHLKDELAALEAEISDPSNPALQTDDVGHLETGDLIRDIVDAKSRLTKIAKLKEGRGRLVNVVLQDSSATEKQETKEHNDETQDDKAEEEEEVTKPTSVRDIAEMDKRVGELEKIIGSSNTVLDEMSPLPPPLLPMISRLNTQLTVLTQPRHIDNISRRLKLLLSDLERLSSNNQQHQSGNQRNRGTSFHPGSSTSSQSVPAPAAPPTHQEQLAPILTRLTPLLPHMPHILTRLRTLSTLHTNAAAFQSTLESLEEEQRRVHAALAELETAVAGVEQSLAENEGVVKNNVRDLEERIDGVVKRVDELKLPRDAPAAELQGLETPA